MIENIKLLIGLILALVEALPQTSTDAAGMTVRIADSDYAAIIGNGVAGVTKAAGFQVAGFSDAQIAGASGALVSLVLAWKAAPKFAGA